MVRCKKQVSCNDKKFIKTYKANVYYKPIDWNSENFDIWMDGPPSQGGMKRFKAKTSVTLMNKIHKFQLQLLKKTEPMGVTNIFYNGELKNPRKK